VVDEPGEWTITARLFDGQVLVDTMTSSFDVIDGSGGSGSGDSGTPDANNSQFPVVGGFVTPPAPAAVTPQTPVAQTAGARSIAPPSTGDGGLAGTAVSSSQVGLLLAVLLLTAPPVAVLAIRRHR
jgi:hypothetical protein